MYLKQRLACTLNSLAEEKKLVVGGGEGLKLLVGVLLWSSRIFRLSQLGVCVCAGGKFRLKEVKEGERGKR